MGRPLMALGDTPQAPSYLLAEPAFGVSWAVSATVRRVSAALGSSHSLIRVVLPDRAGRLRRATAVGVGLPSGRSHPQWTRDVFVVGMPALHPLPGAGDAALALLPLVADSAPLGVVQIVAPHGLLTRQWSRLQAELRDAAGLIRDARRAEVRASVDNATGVEATSVRAPTGTPQALLDAVLDLCFDGFGGPAACWLRTRPDADLSLVGVRGLDDRAREALRQLMPSLPGWDPAAPGVRRRLMAAFGAFAGLEVVSVLDAGEAVLLVGGASPMLERTLVRLQPVVQEAVANLLVAAKARDLRQDLDLGLAQAAHEMRGPLYGARATVERVSVTEGTGALERDLLERTGRELEQLIELVDGMLRWTGREEQLRSQRTDLVRLVREAAESCAMETEWGDRVVIRGPTSLSARVDATYLRSALANLIRNALRYSAATELVTVRISVSADVATISIEDNGPGVPQWEGEAIFAPFSQGEAGRQARSGSGLGLFITRKIVEAHGGRVWVESGGRGARFSVALPLGAAGDESIAGTAAEDRTGEQLAAGAEGIAGLAIDLTYASMSRDVG